MMNMLATAITTAALLLFFYYSDANREPPERVIEAFFLGAVISLQIAFLQAALSLPGAIWFAAFISAGLFEEGVKLAALRLTLFRNPDFTAPVDGITYAVFLSLGFATVENIAHVVTFEMGLVRAVTAVPAHALFAVSMGYYLGRYKFEGDRKLMLYALAVPVLLHGGYNYLILSETAWGTVLFIPYVVFLWWKGMLRHSKLNEGVRKLVNRKLD